MHSTNASSGYLRMLTMPGEHDSKSTSGSAIVLVGPNTYYPLNAFSKKQTVVAISSTEAAVVAANHSMRAEGIPMLALFEQLNLFKKLQGKPARDAAKLNDDPVFTRIDPEIDDIRNGNVDTGCSVADINSLKASFPEFYQVKFMEGQSSYHDGNVHRFISFYETHKQDSKHQLQMV